MLLKAMGVNIKRIRLNLKFLLFLTNFEGLLFS